MTVNKECKAKQKLRVRVEKSGSYRAVAEPCGISHETLRSWLTSATLPTVSQAIKVRDAYKIQLNDWGR